MSDRPELLWDVLADELDDVIAGERRRHAVAASPCRLCGQPTTAISVVCCAHELAELELADGKDIAREWHGLARTGLRLVAEASKEHEPTASRKAPSS